MKPALLLVVAVVPGCVTTDPLRPEEVIPSFGPSSMGEFPADGATPIPIQVCATSDTGRDPQLTAVLLTSGGHWALPDAGNPLSVTVHMSDMCEARDLVPPNDSAPLDLSATMAGVTRTTTVTLTPTKTSTITLGTQGIVSTKDASSIMILATLSVGMPPTALASALPTRGTMVSFKADVNPSDAGYLAQTTITVTSSNMVQTTFVAAPDLIKATVTVTSDAAQASIDIQPP